MLFRKEKRRMIFSRMRLESPTIAGDSPVCEKDHTLFNTTLEYFDTCQGRRKQAALNGQD